MREVRPFLFLTCLGASISAFAAPKAILFTRHAETVANATGKYNRTTLNQISERGKTQIARLTKSLMGWKFDRIVVSPSERALRTIAPYLRATRQKAEIWPELYECCDGNSRKVKGPTAMTLRPGARFVVPADLRDLFIVNPGSDRLFNVPSYEDGLMQVRAAAAKVKADNSARLLVVGHSLQGGRMIEVLLGSAPKGKLKPENATPILLKTAGRAYARVK